MILAAWGRSPSVRDAYHLDFPNMSPYVRDMRSSGKWSAKLPPLQDDHHLAVDACVSRLALRQDNRYYAIVLAYIYGMRDSDIAKVLKCSKSTAANYRKAGENFLDAAIEINLEAL